MPTRQDRIDRYRERHERRRDRAQAEAQRRFDYADNMSKVMNGQPILVGHHSEKRHRRDLQRMDDSMRKGVEAHRQARDSEHALRNLEYTGIDVHDDDAQELLAAKLEKLEKRQAMMKEANRVIRSKPKNIKTGAKLAKLGVPAKVAETLFEDDYGRFGFPSYMLTNNNANIKRLRARQIEVERTAEIEDDREIAAGTCEGQSFRFVTDTGDERIRFEAPRLSRDACKVLRRNGFKWSRNRGVWVRKLTLNAINAIQHWLAPELERLPS